MSTEAGFESKHFVHALDVLNNTDACVLITGKAGTGKSTLLRHFAATTRKTCVILAPTGIAAINAGGQTIHSFFGFPLRPMVHGDEEIKKFNRYHPKSQIMQKMDVLIIDEVSMLRADIIDAIDYSLRINLGRPDKPFGGKQVVFFGDMFQLEPVVQNSEVEKSLFGGFYNSHYFFSAKVFEEIVLTSLELEEVFRQKDEDFIQLLDSIRTNKAGDNELLELNRRLMPDYEPGTEEFVITLCTMNFMAEGINDFMLGQLEGQMYEFKGTVEGDFNLRTLPTSYILQLKVGAQVVFIKNHLGGKYVNGTIAKVESLSPDKIEVLLEDGETIELVQEEWENKRYRFDNTNRRINSEVIGRFKQFPIKLAWAVTIHKSQGLTFEKAVVDMGRGAFAHGQLYVALSRCRTLAGLYLRQEVKPKDIIVDERVVEFSKRQVLNH